MPLADQTYPRLKLSLERWGPSPFADPIFWPSRRTTATTIQADDVLEAVRAMDAGQVAELAELLGVEARHPLLYLPDRSGGFLEPTKCPWTRPGPGA
jgi:hypothetical protein